MRIGVSESHNYSQDNRPEEQFLREARRNLYFEFSCPWGCSLHTRIKSMAVPVQTDMPFPGDSAKAAASTVSAVTATSWSVARSNIPRVDRVRPRLAANVSRDSPSRYECLSKELTGLI
jgi:hypothetical protein